MNTAQRAVTPQCGPSMDRLAAVHRQLAATSPASAAVLEDYTGTVICACVRLCASLSHCLPLVSQVRWCSSPEPGAGSAPGSLCGSPWQAARWRCATCGRTSSAPLRRHADRSVGILPSCVCVRRACVCVQSFPDTELMRQHRLDAISSSLAPSMWRTSRQSKSSAEAQPRSSGGSTASSIPWASWVTARGTFPSLAFSSSWEVKSRRGTGGLLR